MINQKSTGTLKMKVRNQIGMRTPRETSEMLIAKARERSAGTRADNCSLALVRLVAPPPEKKDYKVQGMRRAV